MALAAITKKIQAALAERRKVKTERIYFEAIGEEMELHSLTDAEYIDINSAARGDGKLLQRLIYEACPALSAPAGELVNAGEITDYFEVVDFLTLSDLNKAAAAVNRISGRGTQTHVKIGSEIDEIKNS